MAWAWAWQAREVFLKASKYLEEARKVFVLDGFVTEHCHLTREISRLYRFLAAFEAVSESSRVPSSPETSTVPALSYCGGIPPACLPPSLPPSLPHMAHMAG